MEPSNQPTGSTEIRRKMLVCLLTESDDRDIETIAATGIMSRRNAQVLVTLHRYSQGQTITSHWIERVADMRQPEVSLAMADLIAAEIVTVSESRISKGRPVKIYTVAKPLHQYVKDLMATRQAELNRGVATVNEVFQRRAAA